MLALETKYGISFEYHCIVEWKLASRMAWIQACRQHVLCKKIVQCGLGEKLKFDFWCRPCAQHRSEKNPNFAAA